MTERSPAFSGRKWFTAIFLLTIIFASWTAAQPPPDANKSVDPTTTLEIAGTWKGAYFAFPELMAVTLTVRPLPMDHIEGECELSPAITPAFRNSGSHGSYHFKGTYARWSGEFSFAPDKWIDPKTNTMKPMSGVFDAHSEKLVGLVGETGSVDPVCVLLARGEAGDKLLQEIIASAYPPGPAVKGQAPAQSQTHTAGAASFKVPTADRFVAWASRLREEKPDLDLRHTYTEKLYLLARNLFQDDYFRQFFGATYDNLDAGQRTAVDSLLREPEFRAQLSEWNFLGQAFRPNGSNSSPDISISVFWQRAMRSWMNGRIELLAQMQPEAFSFLKLKSAQSLGAAQLYPLWPSDRAKFDGAIADARVRLARVQLEQGAERAVASAAGFEGARTLAGWMGDPEQSEAVQYAPKELTEKISDRIEARVDELIEPELIEEARALANLGQGHDAVVAGNKWYQSLRQKFAFASKRPPFQHALAPLQARRAADLTAALSEISAKLAAQETEQTLTSKLKGYLSVPGDEATKPAVELRAVADKRLAEIKRDQYLTYFSPNERKWSPQPDGSITLPALVPPPDQEDARVGIVRTIEILGGERTAPYTARWYNNNPLAKAMGIYATIEVQRVGSLSCRPDSSGFSCSYRLQIKVESINPMLKPGDPLESVFKAMTALTTFPTDISSERFELGNHGWWSPGMQDRWINAAHRLNEQLDSQ